VIKPAAAGFAALPEPARPEDLPAIRALLDDNGLPHQDLTPAHLERFLVVRDGGRSIVGAVGAEIHGRYALLRSLVTATSVRRKGLGGRLTKSVEARMAEWGADEAWLLTTTARDFFAARGYVVTDRDSAPPELQDTEEFRSLCPSSAVCMRKSLTHRTPPIPLQRPGT
jgi:amino-acid N-acetyltransferase